MKTWLMCLALVALAIGSIGLAVNDEGGGGGGVYTERSPEEQQRLLEDYRAQLSAQGAVLFAAARAPRPPLVPCDGAEPMPCMMGATQLSDIAGIWRVYFPRPDLNAPDGMAYQRINSDGKLIHADTVENTTAPYGRWPHGRYTFEDGVLVLTVESEGSPPGCETGRFEPWVYRHGAQPVALLLATLEDHCPGRPGHPPFVWVAPAD
jgi:hypothetical protein